MAISADLRRRAVEAYERKESTLSVVATWRATVGLREAPAGPLTARVVSVLTP